MARVQPIKDSPQKVRSHQAQGQDVIHPGLQECSEQQLRSGHGHSRTWAEPAEHKRSRKAKLPG